eukprot:7554871-Lingulodinium_polyedra.AAC.1
MAQQALLRVELSHSDRAAAVGAAGELSEDLDARDRQLAIPRAALGLAASEARADVVATRAARADGLASYREQAARGAVERKFARRAGESIAAGASRRTWVRACRKEVRARLFRPEFKR